MIPRSLRNRTAARLLLAAAVLGGIAGCEKDEIRQYDAPKDPPRLAADAIPSGNEDRQLPVKWNVPRGWRRAGGRGPMGRVATFETGEGENELEIVVSVLLDDAGGIPANINRWRGQLGLEPIDQQEVAKLVTKLANPRLIGNMVDMTGANPAGEDSSSTRLLGALLHDPAGITWIVKAMDRDPVIAAHKDQFVQFVGSFRSTTDSLMPGQSGQADSRQTRASVQPAITWQKPDQWENDPNIGQMLTAAFNITEQGATVRVTVTALRGAGGGALANINRWRRQVGLGPVETLDAQPRTLIDVRGSTAGLIDLISPEPGRHTHDRIVVALLYHDGFTWFFKMTGPRDVVETQKQTFIQFVQSVRFGGGES